jgi:hypothetical protein
VSVRRLSLEEWFLDYQLQSVSRDHFLLPFHLDVPLEPLTAPWTSRGLRAPVPAMVVKAVAVLARRRPEINRMLFRTPLGPRMLEFDGQHVNVPVLVPFEGKDYLSAVTVRDAADKSVEAIDAELSAARTRDVRGLLINRLFIDGKDTLWRRLQLRVLHFLAYRSPWSYARSGGGGLAVSSLYHRRKVGMVARGVAMGPNAWTVGIMAASGEGAQAVLHLGVVFDHGVMHGDTFLAALGEFSTLLADPVGTGLVPEHDPGGAGAR